MALLTPETFEFVLTNELKRAVRSQNFVTLALIQPRDGDRECVLGVGTTRLDAFVTKDAFAVVADVEIVVDLRRLGHGCRIAGIRCRMVPRDRGVAGAGRARNEKPVLMFSRAMFETTFAVTQPRNAAISTSTIA